MVHNILFDFYKKYNLEKIIRLVILIYLEYLWIKICFKYLKYWLIFNKILFILVFWVVSLIYLSLFLIYKVFKKR